jgi:GT2 family glycosyltransferase
MEIGCYSAGGASVQVAVCIVGFRNAADIVNCLSALADATHQRFEVVICENGGQGAYEALTAALPGALTGGQPVRAILASGNLGYAGGINVCIENSRDADAWWILNPDTVPAPDALEQLVRKLGDGSCDAAAGVMFYPDGTIESYGGRWRPWMGRAESIGHGRPVSDPIDPDWVRRQLSYIPGGSMLIGRSFLNEAGPMREDYFLYCEEVEWSLRAVERGLRLGFAPGARVLHNQGTTTGSGASIKDRPKLPIYLDERNKLLVTRDRFPGRFPIAAAAALLLILARYGKRGAWAQLKYGLEGWGAGILNKRGVPEWLERASASSTQRNA